MTRSLIVVASLYELRLIENDKIIFTNVQLMRPRFNAKASPTDDRFQVSTMNAMKTNKAQQGAEHVHSPKTKLLDVMIYFYLG